MSTICKLDTEVRRNRAARRNLLRNHRPRNREDAAVLAELSLIAVNPRLTGATKQALFERGAAQMANPKSEACYVVGCEIEGPHDHGENNSPSQAKIKGVK